MNKDKIIEKLTQSSKKRHLVIGTSLFILILFFIVFSDFGMIKRFTMIYDKNKIENRIQNRLTEIEDLKRKKYNLLNDSTEIERTAREKYGYVKENEIIYVIQSKDE